MIAIHDVPQHFRALRERNERYLHFDLSISSALDEHLSKEETCYVRR